jgi:sigma-B regulation protein RsbU (phosphoserine phosphatase)
VLTVLSGTIFGSALVIWLQPLFSLAQLRTVALIVLVNAAIAVIVGISLNTYDNMKRQIEESYRALREKEALERELGIAREVQRELLPRSVPRVEGLQLAGVCRTAVGVGGDYYDFLPITDRQIGLVIADVSGKGFPAALLMAGLQASVRSLCRPAPQPGWLNARLNEHLYQASSSRYATVFLGFYDTQTRTLSYSNAGHHPPLLLREGAVVRLEEGGMPVGMFNDVQYPEGHEQLAGGDLLALFTDGVIETPNAAEEEFGEERLIHLLRDHGARDLDEIVQSVLGELERWSAGAAAHDDVTLLLARVE